MADSGNRQISVPRTISAAQPDPKDTKKSQKRYTQGDTYDPNSINSEFDYLHERVNQVVVGDPALADLPPGASLADVITRVNLLAATVRKAGLLRSS